MTATEAAAPKNQVIHSPLIRFRKRAHCQNCPLHDPCQSDKTLETRCILAHIANNLQANTQLNSQRYSHL